MVNIYKTNLKIGDDIYLHNGFRLLEYKVYEVRETQDSIQYAIQCQSCTGHEPCKLLIVKVAPIDDNHYRFVSMLNHCDTDEEDYEDEKYQCYTHDTSDYHYFCETKEEALFQCLLAGQKTLKEDIKRQKERLQKLEVKLSETEAHISCFKNKTKELERGE